MDKLWIVDKLLNIAIGLSLLAWVVVIFLMMIGVEI